MNTLRGTVTLKAGAYAMDSIVVIATRPHVMFERSFKQRRPADAQAQGRDGANQELLLRCLPWKRWS